MDIGYIRINPNSFTRTHLLLDWAIESDVRPCTGTNAGKVF